MARLCSRAVPPLLASWLAAAVVCAPSQAHATALQDFQEARQAYADHDYERAVALFEVFMVPAPTISNGLIIRESHKYLGAAYVFVGRREEAEHQFARYLAGEAQLEGANLDPAEFSRDVVTVFDEVQARLIRERDEALERASSEVDARRLREREALLRLITLAEEDEVIVDNSRELALLPFGIGQFQNGDAGLGYAFAISESILATVAAASLLAWGELYADYERATGGLDPSAGGGIRTPDDAPLIALSVINWVSLGTLGIVGIAGILEAQLSFRPNRRVRRRRTVPEDILRDLEILASPSGLGLRLHF